MTEYETVRLLDRIEAYDPSFFSHTKMDKLAVAVWNVVLDGINYEDAVEAVVCHYRASADRITPYKIIESALLARLEREITP